MFQSLILHFVNGGTISAKAKNKIGSLVVSLIEKSAYCFLDIFTKYLEGLPPDERKAILCGTKKDIKVEKMNQLLTQISDAGLQLLKIPSYLNNVDAIEVQELFTEMLHIRIDDVAPKKLDLNELRILFLYYSGFTITEIVFMTNLTQHHVFTTTKSLE